MATSSGGVSSIASKTWVSCPPTTSDALPATADIKATIAGVVANAADVDTSLAEAGSSKDPKVGDVIEEDDELAKGSAEDAKTKEQRRTRLPSIPLCEFA